MDWLNLAAIPFLGVFVWLFHQHSTRVDKRMDIMLERADRRYSELLEVVKNNTEAVTRFAATLDKVVDHFRP